MGTATDKELLTHLRDMSYTAKLTVLDIKDVLRTSKLWSVNELDEAHQVLNSLTDVLEKLSKAEALFHNKMKKEK
jgi:hypothetical protein